MYTYDYFGVQFGLVWTTIRKAFLFGRRDTMNVKFLQTNLHQIFKWYGSSPPNKDKSIRIKIQFEFPNAVTGGRRGTAFAKCKL